LFDDERAHAMPKERWLAPVLAAMAQLEEGTAVDFAAQLNAASSLHGALAELETHWWYGASASPTRAARVATLSHLLHALRRLQDDADRDRLPLPMASLARFSLNRANLRERGDARDQAIKAQLGDIQSSWADAGRLDGPLSVFRALEAGQGEWLLRRAARAGEPLAALQQGAPDGGFRITLRAWNAARRWQKQVG
jgi:15-cis-phytoene synthase